MKRILILSSLLFITIVTNAQLSADISASYTKYRLTDASRYSLNDGIKMNIDISYYFNEKNGLVTGVKYQPINFQKETELFTCDMLQIPLLYSSVYKFNDTPFSLNTSFGYLMSIAQNTKNNGIVYNDLGVIHGAFAKMVLENNVNEKSCYYFGLEASYDFYNKNDIKFTQIGMTCGLRVKF